MMDNESEDRAGQVGDRGSTIDAGRPRADGPKLDRQVSSPAQDDRASPFADLSAYGEILCPLTPVDFRNSNC